MEDRLNQMNAVLQSMQKTLECNICLDLLNKPLTTKCGHSFCTDCIHQVVKNARNGAQCPLCLGPVTRRSLGHNRKITGLVTAVREIIASIKKDCCFEVTPSKYRPRRQPVIPCEEDDSENEENDEPRRGMRKRAVTSHYNAEVHVPKPRAKPAKQRILSSGGGEELNLCMDGKTEMTAVNVTSLHREAGLISYITQEHSYSSPTKQEPHERSSQGKGNQSGKSKGKATSSTRGKSSAKSRKVLCKPIHTYMKKEDADDDHISLSQHMESKADFKDVILNGGEGTSVSLGSRLDQETSADKVEKWLNTSSEVGFRIGLKESSESTVTESSEASQLFQSTDDQKALKPSISMLSLKVQDGTNTGSSDSKEIKGKGPCYTNVESSKLGSESGHTSVHSNEPKFFKSKVKRDLEEDSKDFKSNDIRYDEDDIATVIFKPAKSPIRGTPDDPYKFIPSQKTPKQKVQAKRGKGSKSRARGSLNMGRGRVRGQGPRTSVLKADRRESVADFGLKSSAAPNTQSTPVIKGKSTLQELELSRIIKATDVEVNVIGPGESTIAYSRDDDDDYYGIPDSCPVNTKDEFDEMASEVKEKTFNMKEESFPVKPDDDDDEDDNLLFVTPAQAVEDSESKDSAVPEGKAKGIVKSAQKTGSMKESKPKGIENKKPVVKNKTSKLSKSKKESSDSESSSRSNTSLRMSKAAKAKEEIDAIKAMFDEVDEHQLSTVSLEDDEKQRKVKDKDKNDSMWQNISWHNQTLENTELNKTLPSLDAKAESSMPPPKVPLRNRKVKFNPDMSKTHPVLSTDDENTSVSSSKVATSSVSTSVSKSSRGRGMNKVKSVRTNVRYGSEAKQKILEPSKVQAVSINIKDTKSPGWSHITGARKDLRTRHTSLNIRGGVQRNENEIKTESKVNNDTSYISSSLETNVVIDDQTQENDVEHLNSSQSKIERVKKLKKIVQQLQKSEDGNKDALRMNEEMSKSVKDQMIDEQSQLDREEIAGSIIMKECDNEREYQEKKSSANYVAETEPFDCSNLSLNIEPPVSAPSSIMSTSNAQSRKRKVGDVSSQEPQNTEIKKPSKIARKTFDLGAGFCNIIKEETKVRTPQSEALSPARLPENSVKGKEVTVAESQTSVDSQIASFKEITKPSSSQVTSIKEVSKPCSNHTTLKETSNQVVKASSELQSPAIRASDLPQSSAGIASSSLMPSQVCSNTFQEKPRHPHHALSPSIASTSFAGLPEVTSPESAVTTTTSSGIKGSSSRIIPFKRVGALCSTRCVTASEEAAKIETRCSSTKDLCLHSIPCEVYQVLMKYMNILLTEKEHHRECCSGKPSKMADKSLPVGSAELPKLDSPESKVPQSQECNEVIENIDNDKSDCVVAPFDSEVPNSCDTEELEMAIPLPLSGVALCSGRERERRSSITDRYIKKTVGNDNLNTKIDCQLSSAPESCERKAGGVNKKTLTKNQAGSSDFGLDVLEKESENKQGRCGGKETSQSRIEVLDQCQKEVASECSKETEHNNSCTSEIFGSFSSKTVKKSSSTKTFSQDSVKLIENECNQLEEDYFPSSCEILSSQQSESLLTTPSLTTAKHQNLKMEDKSQKQNPKNKEKIVNLKMNDDVIDIEKENLKNNSNLHLAINRPKRKPLQSGPPDIQNIMSQGTRDIKNPVSEKIEATQLRQLSQSSSKSVLQRPTSTKSLVLNDENTSCRTTRGNASYGSKSSNNSGERELTENVGDLETNNSSQRKFKRIRRPASSSSSDDSDSENVSQRHKRKPNVISSSDSSLSAKVAKIEKKDKAQPVFELDSEEMNDMERFDQNVWEYFGRPDKDFMEDGQGSPLTIDDASQTEKDVDLIPSDDDIPNTDDVMRNVEADMALINKMRQNKKADSQVTVDLSSQASDHFSVTLPSLSVNTKNLLNKVDKNLEVAENLLDGDDAMFQNFCTPAVEEKTSATAKAPSDGMEKSSKSISSGSVVAKAGSSAQVIGESDDESEGDTENVSHSSVHSSQSEALSTQKHKEVQSEVEMLKARVRELEAEMQKKSITKQSADICTKRSERPASPEKNDKSHESEDELFPSLPDFNPSTEPSLPSTANHNNSIKSTGKPVSKPILEACHLVCTGLNSTELVKVDAFVKKVAADGSSFKKSWCNNITHVVVKTDKDMLAQRTLKYLFGVAAGCWVISFQWVLDSLTAKKIMPEDDYEVLDCTGVPGPRRSRTYIKPIFENNEFFLKPPFLEISVDQLKDLLELCGARVLKSPAEFSQKKNIMKFIIIQTDTKHDVQSYLTKYQKVTLGHDWIIECVGMHSLVCVSPFIVGNPTQQHCASSGIPPSLMEESQELTCSQLQ